MHCVVVVVVEEGLVHGIMENHEVASQLFSK